MKSKIIILLCGLFVTGIASAECPSSLNKEDLIKCQKNEADQQSQKASATDSTISPITGKDIKTMAPAAGSKNSKAAK